MIPGPVLLTWITAWIRNLMPSKVWDEISYSFPNFNGTVGIWEWINNISPLFLTGVNADPYWG